MCDHVDEILNFKWVKIIQIWQNGGHFILLFLFSTLLKAGI